MDIRYVPAVTLTDSLGWTIYHPSFYQRALPLLPETFHEQMHEALCSIETCPTHSRHFQQSLIQLLNLSRNRTVMKEKMAIILRQQLKRILRLFFFLLFRPFEPNLLRN